ncbi:hypothetical protein [Persicirhabdus sediminis]|uniref:Uncharacterized protein n=1 Tax=Persicirhabdus sediminis TaxID=454144 RepID=A0A8J7MAK8_9BACT|nr:hypothetical protein [Persicirhabdus sediminis]MBK1789597.1 hypothetical protein [Persicirhabdus sediminis]
MNSSQNYYTHSGGINPLGIIYSIVLGGLACLLLAIIYAYATFYVPFIYLNIIFTIIFGAAVGMAIGLCANWGKIRNNKATITLAVIFAVIAVYFSWVAWLFAYTDSEYLILSPLDQWQAMQMIAIDGVWGIRNITPTGIALYLIWLAEAAIVIAASYYLCLWATGDVPFCERCHKWAKTSNSDQKFADIPNKKHLIKQLENGDLSAIKNLSTEIEDPSAYTQIGLTKCPSCSQDSYLTVKYCSITTDKDGKDNLSALNIVENLIISSADHRELEQKINAAT